MTIQWSALLMNIPREGGKMNTRFHVFFFPSFALWHLASISPLQHLSAPPGALLRCCRETFSEQPHELRQKCNLTIYFASSPVHTTPRNWKTKVLLWNRIKCFPFTLRRRNLKTHQSPAILDLCLSNSWALEYHDCRDVIVYGKLRFQNFFVHTKT